MEIELSELIKHHLIPKEYIIKGVKYDEFIKSDHSSYVCRKIIANFKDNVNYINLPAIMAHKFNIINGGIDTKNFAAISINFESIDDLNIFISDNRYDIYLFNINQRESDKYTLRGYIKNSIQKERDYKIKNILNEETI